jgi:hypothetical protein
MLFLKFSFKMGQWLSNAHYFVTNIRDIFVLVSQNARSRIQLGIV